MTIKSFECILYYKNHNNMIKLKVLKSRLFAESKCAGNML